MKGHIAAHDPATNDEERSNQESNLNAGTNSNTHGQIHLIPQSDNNSSDMLSSITDDGNQNQTNESLADTGAVDKVIDAVNQVFGANSDQDCGNDKNGASGNGADDGLLGLVVLIRVLVLDFEKVAVGSELEDEVENVEKQKDDGGSSGEREDALHLLIGVGLALVENGI